MTSFRKTEALVLIANGEPLKHVELAVAEPASNQLLVQMYATGICQTDLTCASTHVSYPTPSILGHEGAGVIVALGGGLESKFKIGDSVLCSFNSCGDCYSCSNDHPAYCKLFQRLNGPHLQQTGVTGYTMEGTSVLGGFFGQSSFSRFTLVDQNCVVVLPDVSPDELATFAPLGCGIQTGAGAVINTLALFPGSSFAVFGAGAVGLSALIMAKILGAATLIAIDLVDERLELAKDLGATHIIKGRDLDIVSQIKVITNRTGGVQFAIDTTGVTKVIETMVEALGSLGKACSLGAVPPGTKVSVDVSTLMSSGKSFTSCVEGDSNPSKFIPYLISEIRAGNFPLEKLVKFYPLENFKLAWEDMANSKAIKPIIRWN